MLGIVVDDDGKLTMTPKGLADRWRDRPIGEINGDDIHLIVDEVRERRSAGTEAPRWRSIRGDGAVDVYGVVADVSLGCSKSGGSKSTQSSA